MHTVTINQRIRFIVKWSPLLLAAALVWLFLTLRRDPVPLSYLIVCVGIGLLCGGLIILDFWKDPSPLLLLLVLSIFSAGDIILRDLFFPGVGILPGRRTSSQYILTVLVSMLGLVMVLRSRMMRNLSQADVEQALAANSVERDGIE